MQLCRHAGTCSLQLIDNAGRPQLRPVMYKSMARPALPAGHSLHWLSRVEERTDVDEEAHEQIQADDRASGREDLRNPAIFADAAHVRIVRASGFPSAPSMPCLMATAHMARTALNPSDAPSTARSLDRQPAAASGGSRCGERRRSVYESAVYETDRRLELPAAHGRLPRICSRTTFTPPSASSGNLWNQACT